MRKQIEEILSRCKGVEVKSTDKKDWRGQTITTRKLYKIADVELPDDDIFIKIIATATKGTIAKLSMIEAKTYGEEFPDVDSYVGSTEIVTYGVPLTFEVDGRKQKGRIQSHHVEVLDGVHETKYVRDVTKHKKVEIKNPVNKYKQEMKRGDWVVGVTQRGKCLGIGRITRWTNSNVWGVTGDDMNDKSKEFQFVSIRETFTMPGEEHVKLLTMAVLRGWDGA